MPFLFLLSKNYSFGLLVLYIILLLFTISNVALTIIIFIGLFIIMQLIKERNLTFLNKLALFFIFYFLSSISHFFTGEPMVLKANKLSVYSVAINTFYFIPFSILCL
jgi:hypothetical protein